MLHRLRKSFALLLFAAILSLGTLSLPLAGGSDEPAYTGGNKESQQVSPPPARMDRSGDGHGQSARTSATNELVRLWLVDLVKQILSLPPL